MQQKEKPIKNISQPFERFFKLETSSSILLLLFTIIALFIANSPISNLYHDIMQYKFTIGIAEEAISKPLILWINDGLMAIFFFVIGLEIKREIKVGELSNIKKASLPIFAAIGGIAFPVVIFFLANNDSDSIDGWAIPMATDIAFTLGILKLLGNRVPYSLKVFLTAFAIVDDLGAILIIAFFYSSGIKWMLVFSAIGIVIFLMLLSRISIYSKYLYFIAGLIVWYLFLKSGVHATIAGVLMALTIPIRRKINIRTFKENMTKSLAVFIRTYQARKRIILSADEMGAIDTIAQTTEEIQSPLQYLENRLHAWVVYFIMPIFAFANAGVSFIDSGETNISLSLAIILGLVLGKSIGISLMSYIAIKTGISEKLSGVNFKNIIGIGFLGGLGFTMSLFITNLAFTDMVLINSSKIGILMGSFIAGLIGYLILNSALKKRT